MSDISKELVKLRPYNEETDKSFIFATWLRAYYHGNGWRKGSQRSSDAPIDLIGTIPKHDFMITYQKVIEALLKKSQINIACLKEDDDVILGYSVSQGDILHWVFVKDLWRKIGVSKMLIAKETKFVTHLTRLGRNIKPNEWRYNPFL